MTEIIWFHGLIIKEKDGLRKSRDRLLNQEMDTPMKKLEEKTHEELVEQIRRMQDRFGLNTAERQAKEEAFIKRLAILRKAKALANIRADKAELIMRNMLDTFSQKEQPDGETED